MRGDFYLLSAFASNDRLSAVVPEGTRWFYCGNNTVNFHRVLEAFGPGRPEACSPREFSAFVDQIRPVFIAECEKINAAFGQSLDYWVDDLFSKNPHLNDVFVNYCYLQFAERLLGAGEGASLAWVIEDEQLAPLVAGKALAAGVRCVDESGARDMAPPGRSGLLLKFLSYAKFVASSLSKWFLARFVHPSPRKGPVRWDILFETYMIKSDFNADGGWRDRYLPGLAAYASAQGYKTAVTPIFPGVGVGGYKAILRLCRAHPDNGIVIMEDWLHFSDYLYALLHLLRRTSRRRIAEAIEQADIKALVLQQWMPTLFSTMSFEALVRYRFVSRLRKAGVEVNRVIMWYENQALHKAFAWGVREEYPGAVLVGAQMFVPPVNHLSLYVTEEECRMRFVPDALCLPGPAYLSCFAQFAPKERFGIAASMRYGHLLTQIERNPPGDDGSVVAVLLPQSLSISLSLLRLLFGAVKGEAPPPILIRTHPTVSPAMVQRYLREMGVVLSEKLFTNENLYDLLRRAAVVVSSASGTIMEAVCMGKPVIEIASAPGLDFSLQVPPVAAMFHRKAFTADETKSALFGWALGSFRATPLRERDAQARTILEECFIPNIPARMRMFFPDTESGLRLVQSGRER